MNDDELLAAAHKAAKEKDPLADPRWDAFSRGELSEEESDALRTDPSAFAAFAPLDTEAMERLVVEKMPHKARVLPFRRFRAWAATATVLAAAAIALVVFRPKDGGMFPAYEMTVHGEKLERGAEPAATAPVRFGPGSRVEIVLRPETAFRSAVGARLFCVREGRATKLDVPVQRSEEGALRFVGSFDVVFRGFSPGAWELVAAIGPEERLPAEDDVLRIESSKGGVQIVRTPILIVDR